MSRLLLTLPMTLLALSAGAEPTPDACEARAARVVAQLEQEAAEPLSRAEAGLARRAALAACQGRYTPPERAADEAASPAPAAELARAEPEATRFERFVAGLFALQPGDVKTRPGGKYRYIDKD